MNRVKKFLKILEEEDTLVVNGFGTVTKKGAVDRVRKHLEGALKALEEENYQSLNWLVGREGSGVLGAMATALYKSEDANESLGAKYSVHKNQEINVTVNGSPYLIKVIDSSHAFLKPANSKSWGIADHVRQLPDEVIASLQRLRVMDKSKFFIMREEE